MPSVLGKAARRRASLMPGTLLDEVSNGTNEGVNDRPLMREERRERMEGRKAADNRIREENSLMFAIHEDEESVSEDPPARVRHASPSSPNITS